MAEFYLVNAHGYDYELIVREDEVQILIVDDWGESCNAVIPLHVFKNLLSQSGLDNHEKMLAADGAILELLEKQ